MNRFLKALSAFCAMALLFTGCWWKDDDDEKDDYTVLVYMAADNSLDTEVDYTLRELKEGILKSTGNVVVYLDRADEAPRLFRIAHDGQEIPLESYAEENSADAATLARVIRETKEKVPSTKFGLVIWSHSMGWVPEGYEQQARVASARLSQKLPRTRFVSLDDDTGSGDSGAMEIDDLAENLTSQVAEFILFDVCLMGNVEALYQIRHTCHYAIASPTEVFAESRYNASGMPYSKVLPYLFGDLADLAQACAIYYNYYKDLDIEDVEGLDDPEMLRSATISLIDMQQLDGLYNASAAILGGKLSEAEVLNTNGIQIYHTASAAQVFFDMADIMKALGSTSQYADFEDQLEKTVLYKAATSNFITIPIDPDHFSGLSMYIPLSTWSANKEYSYYFSQIDWSGVYD